MIAKRISMRRTSFTSDSRMGLSTQKSGAADDHDLRLTYTSTADSSTSNDSFTVLKRASRALDADAGATSDRGRHGSVLCGSTTDGHDTSPDHRRGSANVESDFEIHASLIASKDDTLVQEEAEWLLKVLRGHFLFSSMPVNQLLLIVKKMERVGCKAGQEL